MLLFLFLLKISKFSQLMHCFLDLNLNYYIQKQSEISLNDVNVYEPIVALRRDILRNIPFPGISQALCCQLLQSSRFALFIFGILPISYLLIITDYLLLLQIYRFLISCIILLILVLLLTTYIQLQKKKTKLQTRPQSWPSSGALNFPHFL